MNDGITQVELSTITKKRGRPKKYPDVYGQDDYILENNIQDDIREFRAFKAQTSREDLYD